jgi:tetratricopeptide (TPR) repeat protein
MKRFPILLTALALGGPIACDKKSESTTPPDATAGDGGGPVEPDVPQEPDPPEIEQGVHAYLLGNYQEAIDILDPVYADLKQRKQYRASGLAGGWLAAAHAQVVFENGEEPATHAVAMADRTQDPEVVAAAKLGRGAFLLGTEDFDGAAAAFDQAASAAPQTSAGALANILRAQAMIGSAFGSGESTQLHNPQDLEKAKKAYEAAEGTAKGGVETEIIMGRVEEGRAAIAKYQNDSAALCQHATKALEHYKTAGASDFLVEGPQRLAVDNKCETSEASS